MFPGSRRSLSWWALLVGATGAVFCAAAAAVMVDKPPVPVSNATDLSVKPRIHRPHGSPPDQLETYDFVRGHGARAQNGDRLTVQYVGSSWSTGKEFDSSWSRKQPFVFPLGKGYVIEGWERGLRGMRVGGRRELVLPPRLAYGAESPGPGIGPNETLIFVVDLQGVYRPPHFQVCRPPAHHGHQPLVGRLRAFRVDCASARRTANYLRASSTRTTYDGFACERVTASNQTVTVHCKRHAQRVNFILVAY